MKNNIENLKNYLKKHDIKPSTIRIKTLEYLLNNDIHPNVEEIYCELINDIPTLSKTSIYNTLELFIEKGIVQMVRVDEKESRYDLNTTNHGHFKCNECGRIYDFHIFDEEMIKKELKGYKIENKDIYYYGICKNCNEVLQNN